MTEDQEPSAELGHQIYQALTIAAEVVCELKCPSVWKTAEKQPHSDECKRVRAARSAWMDHCSYLDLIASGGLPKSESPVFECPGCGRDIAEPGTVCASDCPRARGGPTESDPNRPHCKPDQSCCDFCCGN